LIFVTSPHGITRGGREKGREGIIIELGVRLLLMIGTMIDGC
jgi:hypothetical protein